MISGQKKHKKYSLILKIALGLNYLSRVNYQKLITDIQNYKISSKRAVYKMMIDKQYITHKSFINLDKICTVFATKQSQVRFGSLCVEFGFLSQSNLDLSLEEQRRLVAAKQNIKIGELLIDAGMLSKEQCNLILQKQKLDRQIPKNTEIKISSEADNTPPFDKSNMKEIREPEFGVTLFIQNDAFKAFVRKTDDFSSTMDLDSLKFLLEKNGIIYGLAADDNMGNFIKKNKYKDTCFEIAKGLDPIGGIDSEITYMFERDFLKAGNLAKDGSMDFKSRGDIPLVEKGDVLAEKISLKEGKDGKNIYGEAVLHAKASDIPFVTGENVTLSKDKLLVMADTAGNPKVKSTGEICVNDAYVIEGDVDYSTGHIKFDKNVYITGTVKSGFSIEAIDVVADAARGCTIKAKGDVFIQNGTTESSIYADGNINAGFVHKSKTSCLGDMNVAKEMVDTNAIVEGVFDMSAGRLFSSSICAKGGAKIYRIGSQRAKFSSITLGTSTLFDRKFDNIEKTIEQNQILLEEKINGKNNINNQLNAIIEKINKFDQSKQRTFAMIEEMKKNNKRSHDSTIASFQQSIDESQKKINDLNDRKTLIETDHKKIEADMALYSKNVTNGVKEKFAFKRQQENSVSKPVLDVAGKAFAGTKVHGIYAALTLKQDLTRSRIMEIKTGSNINIGSNNGREMIVTNL